MDHPCYKCGHSVEDGKPFCSQCGAPQIRVAMPQPSPAIAENVPDHLPIFPSDQPISPDVLGGSPLPGAIEWSTALRACAIAALIAGLIMSLGLMVPLLAALGAGFLAVNIYHRRDLAWRVNARSGAQLGAMCGILFFGVSAIFETLAVVLFHTAGQVRLKMLEALQQASSHTSDPQVQAAFDRLKTPEGLALMMVFGLIFLFLVSIAAASLAGALTGAFLGRRKRL